MMSMVKHNGRPNTIQGSNMIPMINRNGRRNIIRVKYNVYSKS